jgi:hypothetical protein
MIELGDVMMLWNPYGGIMSVGYYYPILEIVGVSNGFIRPWAILIS